MFIFIRNQAQKSSRKLNYQEGTHIYEYDKNNAFQAEDNQRYVYVRIFGVLNEEHDGVSLSLRDLRKEKKPKV